MNHEEFFIETKVDGERIQLHKRNEEYRYFSRGYVIVEFHEMNSLILMALQLLGIKLVAFSTFSGLEFWVRVEFELRG